MLGDALLVERVAVADGVERRLRALVGDLQQEQAAEARILGSGGEQRPLGLQLAQVGAVRFLVHDDFVERSAIADNGDGIHGDSYFRHWRDVRQGI